jgi:nucleoside-diphosphate-sugar epimerase
VFGSVDYDLTKKTQKKDVGSATPGGITELSDKIKEIVEKNKGISGAIIFASAERDPAIFGHCKDKETYSEYLKKAVGNPPSLADKRKELMNLNTLAPTDVFDKIKEFPNVSFVYISSIYVFEGRPNIRDRKEVIEDNTLDFVDNIKESIDNHDILFSEKHLNLYALGKRYVELYLNDKIVKEGAKVVILRMDGITPEPDNPKSLKYADGTFLLALSNPVASYNVVEKRYPVFPSQISKVIISAINNQTDQLKVYHVAGTEKEKGTTKGDIIREVLKDSIITKDRHMNDTNAFTADKQYANIDGTFFDKLKGIFDGIPKAGGRKKS